MYGKLGTIVTIALALSGCAASPFYVSKKASYAPGFIPRNELGEPVFPAPQKGKRDKAIASLSPSQQAKVAASLS